LINQFYLLLYKTNIKFFKKFVASLIRRGVFINKIQTIKLNNFKINLNLAQSIDREIFLKRTYEKQQLNLLKKVSKEQSFECFLDIGANIGYYSLFLNHIKKIYAFEPNKYIFSNLKENIKINKFNIEIFNFAISNENNQKEIWYSDKNKMGGSAIFDLEDKALNKYDLNKIFKDKIETKKIDSFIKFNDCKILIKMDVERHENKALDGMKQLIEHNQIFLQIEIHDSVKKKIFLKLKHLKFKFIQSIGMDYFFKNY
jgi:FkbM family methyltransferase